MNAETTFRLNGRTIDLVDANPTHTLLRWLRKQALTGTKEGCGDGDCGACTVALLEPDGTGGGRFIAVNSCLLPVGQLAGREVFTVEALAEGEKLHPVQQAMVDHMGSQCGYCTPGFVMSLFAGYHGGELSDHTTEGNLCRCTGYRPIREATTALKMHPDGGDRFEQLKTQPRTALSAATLGNFFNPTALYDAIALKQAHPEAAFIAGGTDLGVNLSHGRSKATHFIALDRIAELHVLHTEREGLRVGAGIPLTRLELELAGQFPLLDQLLPWFAARQVRNRATIGGNLGSASPIGDLAPALLAMDAQLELVGPEGRRRLPIHGFFLDYRKTQRAPDELISAVLIPPQAGFIQAAYKVAKRQTDDISIVAAMFSMARDKEGRLSRVRLAFGGVAAIPLRATAVEEQLDGLIPTSENLRSIAEALSEHFTPLSDHRASAEYRRSLCRNLFVKFAREHLNVEIAL